MTGTVTLYHPIHAPDGQAVFTDSGPLTSYADDGWVDDPAKIGINPWGDDQEHQVAKRHREYLSGELPGISPGYGKDEGPRCAIWNTVATDESEPGRDGMSLNSPRAGGQYFISGSAAAMVASRDECVKARLTTWLVDQRRSGIRRPEVMTSSIDDAARNQDLTVRQRVDRLLDSFSVRSPRIGATLFVLSCTSSISFAVDEDNSRDRALDEIYGFAARYCGEFQQTGTSQIWTFSGDVDAVLRGYLSKFAEIQGGIEGELSISKHEGLLRDHLLSAFKSRNDCRQAIWNDLFRLFFGVLDGDVASDVPLSYDKSGQTLLHHAILHNNLDEAIALQRKGIYTNIRDRKGQTELHLAARYGDSTIVTALLNGDSDPTLLDHNGQDSLHIACRYADSRTVTALLNANVDPNVPDNRGDTPLHIAAHYADRRTIVALLNANANPNQRDNDHQTTLHIAARYARDIRVFSVLIDGSSERNAQDSEGRTPLHVAARFGNTKTAIALVDAGVIVDLADNNGRSPLHLAAMRGSSGVVRTLLNADANPNFRDRRENTPLHFAVEEAPGRVVTQLIDAGADPNATDDLGRTPLYNAASHDNVEAIKALIDGRANVNSPGFANRTPLDEATRRGNHAAVSALRSAGGKRSP